MKRLFTLLILALTFAVGSYAQNEVHIVQETGTTVVNLDEVSSIDLTDEPWGEWEETSGVFNFSLYVSGAYKIPVYYRDHMIDATKAQFLLGFTAIGAKEDVLVDVNTETGACQVGVHYFLDSSKYGPVYVSDIPHYPLQPGLTYDKYPCTFNAERGLFSFNLIYFVSTDLGSGANGSFGYGVETLQLDSIPQVAAAARAPKAKLGRIEAIEAFEMPVKKSAGKKSNELIGVEPKVNVTLRPVPSVKFKKADASQNGLVER